jgi:hypothetical protein
MICIRPAATFASKEPQIVGDLAAAMMDQAVGRDSPTELPVTNDHPDLRIRMR